MPRAAHSFVTTYEPPESRQRFAQGGIEERITEAAVMIAFAEDLFARGAVEVAVHPDGEHAKTLDIPAFLEARGFELRERLGSTAYGGRYERGAQTIVLRPHSGRGDVVAEIDGVRILAECKGGTINSRHSGRLSNLRKGMAETIGQLMTLPDDGAEHVAVVPATPLTAALAEKLALRCGAAGIRIALVERDGSLRWFGRADGAD